MCYGERTIRLYGACLHAVEGILGCGGELCSCLDDPVPRLVASWYWRYTARVIYLILLHTLTIVFCWLITFFADSGRAMQEGRAEGGGCFIS